MSRTLYKSKEVEVVQYCGPELEDGEERRRVTVYSRLTGGTLDMTKDQFRDMLAKCAHFYLTPDA